MLRGIISRIAMSFLIGCLSSPAFAFDFRVFSDVTFSRASSDSESLDENGAFALGELDLFLSSLVYDRIEVLSELVVEQELADDPAIDLERLQVGYILNDAIGIHVGRFHNVLGYWNTAFHHGYLYQTSIRRPEFLEFEDAHGILPVHAVGLRLSGRPMTSSLKIDYGLIVANGSHLQPDDDSCCILKPESVADPNKEKAVSGNFTFWPVFLPGLGIGVFGQHSDEVLGFATSDLEAERVLKVRQSIVGGHLVFIGSRTESAGPQLLSEIYLIRNKDELLDAGVFRGRAYYVQLAYPISKRFLPYARLENLSLETDDPYFALLGAEDYTLWLVGLRFSLNPNSAMKIEIQRIDRESLDRYARFAAQWAFAF